MVQAEDVFDAYDRVDEDRMKYKVALTEVIKAWEALPMGHYSPREIERWMHDHMKPAIDKAREVMNR